MGNSFAPYIRQIANKKGLTQRAIADPIGMDFGYISKIFSGRVLPESDTIKKLCKTLKPTPGEEYELARRAGLITGQPIEDAVANWQAMVQHRDAAHRITNDNEHAVSKLFMFAAEFVHPLVIAEARRRKEAQSEAFTLDEIETALGVEI